jgi:branched-chain amino acid transport system substrate-binding protein
MNKKAKVIWWVVGLVIIIGIVLWIVLDNAASAKTIKIGFIGPLTGDGAIYGEPFQKTVELAVSEINATGGIDGKQIQIIYEDGKCDGQDGASAAQKLVSVDGVQAIIGGLCSGETIPAVPIAAAGKVVMLSDASSPKLTGISPYFFRDYPSDDSQGKVLADAAYNTKHWRTVAILQEQTDYAAGVADAFSQEFQKLGGKIINEQYVTDTTDFRSSLLKLKSQNPDALFLDPNGTADAPIILEQMSVLQWSPPLLVNDSVATDAKTVSADATALEGALTAQFVPNTSNPKFQHLLSAYKAKYGIDLASQDYGQAEYDAVYLLADGIRAVGYNGTALAKWSRTITNWQGASGAITIDANGDRVGGHVLEVIHNGALQSAQ